MKVRSSQLRQWTKIHQCSMERALRIPIKICGSRALPTSHATSLIVLIENFAAGPSCGHSKLQGSDLLRCVA